MHDTILTTQSWHPFSSESSLRGIGGNWGSSNTMPTNDVSPGEVVAGSGATISTVKSPCKTPNPPPPDEPPVPARLPAPEEHDERAAIRHGVVSHARRPTASLPPIRARATRLLI